MIRILVVEDNKPDRDLLCRLLTRAGYEVLFAEDGPRGVSLVGEQRPDLVLMDVMLGAMDGIEATKLIKADPAVRGTPIIALTNDAGSNIRRRSDEAGCGDIDTKPIDLARLLGKIRRQLKSAA
jgi:two-component system cell cycle response regulator DivK